MQYRLSTDYNLLSTPMMQVMSTFKHRGVPSPGQPTWASPKTQLLTKIWCTCRLDSFIILNIIHMFAERIQDTTNCRVANELQHRYFIIPITLPVNFNPLSVYTSTCKGTSLMQDFDWILQLPKAKDKWQRMNKLQKRDKFRRLLRTCSRKSQLPIPPR